MAQRVCATKRRKTAGILCVFQGFSDAFVVQKIKPAPKAESIRGSLEKWRRNRMFSVFCAINIRRRLKHGNMTDSEGFFCQTRRFDAGILDVFQGKTPPYDGKRAAVPAF